MCFDIYGDLSYATHGGMKRRRALYVVYVAALLLLLRKAFKNQTSVQNLWQHLSSVVF